MGIQEEEIKAEIIKNRKLRSFEEQSLGLKMFFQMSGVADPFDLWHPHLWYDKIGGTGWHCELLGPFSRPLFYGVSKSLNTAVLECASQAKDFYKKFNSSEQP